ncbi:MAG: molybdopterin cofactor-binding domain-containing protein, partial [Actinomycetota bacterium]
HWDVDPDRLVEERPAEEFASNAYLDEQLPDWASIVAMTVVVDEAVTRLVRSFRESSFAPLRSCAAKLLEEERYHAHHGEGWLRTLARDEHERPALAESIGTALASTLFWLGPTAAAGDAELIAAAVKDTSDAAIAAGLRRDILALAGSLGLEGRLRVRCPEIGGGFGQKAHVFPEVVVVAWAALHLRRPVAWVEDRRENLIASSHAREQLVRARVGADSEGRLLALDAQVYSDVGAYGIYPWGQVLEALGTPAMLPGPYVLESYRYRTQAIATNKAPQGAYRGVGLPVAAFVHERLMDLLAAEAAIDPAEIRRANFIPPERLPYRTTTGLRYDSGNYRAALDRALESIDYAHFPERQHEARRAGRRIGVGFASYVEWTGTNSNTYRVRGMSNVRGYDAGRVAVNRDGTVSVWTSCPAIGQGVATTFSQIVAGCLDVPFESVRTELVDTAQSPPGSGSFASRSAISAGGALIAVSGELRRRLIEVAADDLEASPADLVIEGGRVSVRGSPSLGLTLAELATRAEPGRLDIAEPYDPEETAYPYATHACIVEVDSETGQVRILRYVVAEDCGPEINPIVVEGQVHGATAQGIGGTLYEAMRYGDDGQVTTSSLMDYLVPTACELPEFVVHHLETPAPDLRGGFKGVGEGGTLAPPGALANAVSDALGLEVNELPIQPEMLLRRTATGGR